MSRPIPYKRLTRAASLISVCVALVLVAVKVWAWIATGSIAMLTSAADGLVDVLASMVTLVGVSYAGRPADKGHRYGHGKAEAVAAFVQALLLGAAGIVLGGESISRIINPQPLAQLGLGIWVIIASCCAAVCLVLMQTYVVKRTGSTAIAADRAHYITDVAVNIAVLVALLLESHLSWTRSDSIGALLISLYMIWNARSMVGDALKQLLDRELDIEDRKRIKNAVLSVKGVSGVHDIRTRNGGDRVFVEFHVEVDGNLSVDVGHDIGDAAEVAVSQLFSAADVTAHLEPAGIDDDRLDDLLNNIVK
ncbi:cation diffusion facilitator family transporter [Hafnia psychrotolerans]|jgi:cation diffusion facilitator family transporter|uniref:Transporter n=1 Tax=Hafnia psychrotolerans TaxID=1477018 RepID=A0ABQ1G121_9GAMM|nr:cation diffusion facilitator family transporter [Hafnia psychrotolerans]GGA35348.1 transporter [Hafnia psychrotolerans]